MIVLALQETETTLLLHINRAVYNQAKKKNTDEIWQQCFTSSVSTLGGPSSLRPTMAAAFCSSWQREKVY